MKKRSREPKQVSILAWTFDQAHRAEPYLASVVNSIRDHTLAAIRYERAVKRLADKPGRQDRDHIIAEANARAEADRSKQHLTEELQELRRLDLFCLDPIQGLALIPTVNEEELAWFVFDLFAEEKVAGWRYHKDPLTVRRPIDTFKSGVPEPTKTGAVI